MVSAVMPSIVLQVTNPISNIEQGAEAFGQVVSLGDPIAIAMLVLGALLTAFAMAVMGYLTVGAIFSGIGRIIAREPPREGGAH